MSSRNKNKKKGGKYAKAAQQIKKQQEEKKAPPPAATLPETMNADAKEFVPSVVEVPVSSEEQALLEQLDQDTSEGFVASAKDCECCHGLIESCGGRACKDLGVCFCQVFPEDEDKDTAASQAEAKTQLDAPLVFSDAQDMAPEDVEAIVNASDTWFPDRKDCPCCSGYSLRCNGGVCGSAGNCDCQRAALAHRSGMRAGAAEFVPEVKEASLDPAEQTLLEQLAEDTMEGFFPAYQNCSCCHGLVYSCSGVVCRDLEGCICLYEEDEQDPSGLQMQLNDGDGADEWFADRRDCPCCHGYALRCGGKICGVPSGPEAKCDCAGAARRESAPKKKAGKYAIARQQLKAGRVPALHVSDGDGDDDAEPAAAAPAAQPKRDAVPTIMADEQGVFRIGSPTFARFPIVVDPEAPISDGGQQQEEHVSPVFSMVRDTRRGNARPVLFQDEKGQMRIGSPVYEESWAASEEL